MTPAEQIARADQAKAELTLTKDAFETIRRDCLDRMLKLSRTLPINAEGLSALAMMVNVVDEVEGSLGQIIAGGEVAERELARLREKEQMSPAERRWADAL